MEPVTIDLAREFAAPEACGAQYAGYEDVSGNRRALPVGSSLDEATGQFAWQPGPGFVGSYRLVFERRDCAGNVLSAAVTIAIVPKH